MYLHSFRVKNFRRLKDVRVELERDISIFVGANNSGKTSATQAVQLFMACSKEKFSIHDFSAGCWTTINEIAAMHMAGGRENEVETALATFPTISLDLWFNVAASDLARVIDLLPSLTWTGSHVGIRIEFGATNARDLLSHYSEAKEKIAGHPQAWPLTLTDYLSERLNQEFELRYYVLDHASFDAEFKEVTGYLPLQLSTDKGRGGAQIIKNILRVDCLDAQRHLSDSSGSRSEDLSRCLSRFYSRNLKKHEEDYTIQEALSDAKTELDQHLEKVFGPTLTQLSELGYPGLSNPSLRIKSALNPATIMSSQDGATVHYVLERADGEAQEYTLPDRYNGLGFKNLIYMVIELLDLHTQWMDTDEDRPLLHLIFIEEPEAHLHAQLQQVFIRKVLDILEVDPADADFFISQLVVTTHSPHILYERGFQPIRYFRRGVAGGAQTSEVLNLSSFYKNSEPVNRDFLERYMKLVHCDLFFADAAILVEGNVERLLMPLMITKEASQLKSSYLSILEIGGAFGYRFKSLIEFLGIATLIVTDIDSVLPTPAPPAEEDGDEEEDEEASPGSACQVSTPDAVTSNQTLIQWLPRKTLIAELLIATEAEKTQVPTSTSGSHIRVVYQKPNDVTWDTTTASLTGRTFEEAFAYENFAWSQHANQRLLGLYIRGNAGKTLVDMSLRLYKRVKGSAFNKTDFALSLLAKPSEEWAVPRYIAEGLTWLAQQIVIEDAVAEVVAEPIATEII